MSIACAPDSIAPLSAYSTPAQMLVARSCSLLALCMAWVPEESAPENHHPLLVLLLLIMLMMKRRSGNHPLFVLLSLMILMMLVMRRMMVRTKMHLGSLILIPGFRKNYPPFLSERLPPTHHPCSCCCTARLLGTA